MVRRRLVPAFPASSSLGVVAVAAAASLTLGFLAASADLTVFVNAFSVLIGLLAIAGARRWWRVALWVVLFGLSLFSYGFNNVPLATLPVPLAEALVVYAVLGSAPVWWKLRRNRVVSQLLLLTLILSAVVAGRLVVDLPRFGLSAGRDALFALELWMVFPAIAAGYLLGRNDVGAGSCGCSPSAPSGTYSTPSASGLRK